MTETITRAEWSLLVEMVRDTNTAIGELKERTTEALTRLDHPDPRDCTQQETLKAVLSNQVEIFHRLSALEKFNAKIVAIVAVISALVTLALSWFGQMIWKWFFHHAQK